jgi:hypothetical protein
MIGFSDEVSGTVISTDKKTLTFDPPLITGWELEPTLKIGLWHQYLYYPDTLTISDAELDWNYSSGELNSVTLINGGSYDLSDVLYGQGQIDNGFFYINPNPLEEYTILGINEEDRRFSLLNEFTVGEPNTGFTVNTSTNTVTGSAVATGIIRGVSYEIEFGLKYVNNGEGLVVDDVSTDVFVDGDRKILASKVLNFVDLYWDGIEWKLSEYLGSEYQGAKVDIWFRFDKLQYLTSINPLFSSDASSGPIAATGNSSVSGDLVVSGDLTVDGDLYVSPNSLYLGNMHLSTDDNTTLLVNGTPVSAGGGGGGDFNQNLNTTNDVEFNSVAVPALTLVGDAQAVQDAYDSSTIQYDDLQADINELNDQILQKISQRGNWFQVIAEGPSNPAYSLAVSSINQLNSEINQLQGQISSLAGQAGLLSTMLDYYIEVLASDNLSPIVFDYLNQCITFDRSIKIPADARIINSSGQVLLGDGHNSNKFTTISVSGQSNISADSTSDTLTFAAGSGISITTDAASDIITITNTSQGGGSMATRTIVDGSTTSLTDGSTGSIDITGFKGYVLYKVTTSAAAWVRIYTSNAARSADASRLEGVDPSPDSGVIAEIITTEAETVLISPGAFGFNDELTPTTNIPVTVTNKSGSTATVSVTLTVLQLEA